MKSRIRYLLAAVLLGVALFACGVCDCSREKQPKQEGAAGRPGELADSTRMDSAPPGSHPDTLSIDTIP